MNLCDLFCSKFSLWSEIRVSAVKTSFLIAQPVAGEVRSPGARQLKTTPMFHPVPSVAHAGPNHDATHDMDAEGEHDMDIDPSPSPSTAQNGQQPSVRHDQYTSSDAEADGDFEDDETMSLPPSRPAGYTNGSASTPAGGSALGASRINFATVDPALYGLRRSVRMAIWNEKHYDRLL